MERKNDNEIPFVDDFANENLRGDTLRRNDGTTRYSSSADDERRPRRRVTKMSRRRRAKRNMAPLALVVFFLATLAVLFWIILGNSKKESAPEKQDNAVTQTAADGTTAAPDDTEAPEADDNAPRTVTVENTKVREGDLILVNYLNEYVFPEDEDLVLMNSRTEHFSVCEGDVDYLRTEAFDAFLALTSDMFDATGYEWILVNSTYRGLAEQQKIYDDYTEAYGSAYAAAYVANPGYSEHHTGLALDLVIDIDGERYHLDTYDGAAWFNENYDKYGFILRYPEEKADKTAINYEGWHYRYVGVPHAQIMDTLDLCLEEYTDYLREHTADSAVCFNTNDSSVKFVDALSYERAEDETLVYFTAASDGDATEITVPAGEYEISGNNVDGFVVTVG